MEISEEMRDWLPYSYPEVAQHILTSMIKRTDKTVFDAIEDYSRGTFTPGRRDYIFSNDGMDYERSGGFVEEFVPVLENFKRQIVDGLIEIPVWPEDKMLPPPLPKNWTQW